MTTGKKRGRKPIHASEEERMEAKRLYAKNYYAERRKSVLAKTKAGCREKDMLARLEKLEAQMEKMKWELYGRKICV